MTVMLFLAGIGFGIWASEREAKGKWPFKCHRDEIRIMKDCK